MSKKLSTALTMVVLSSATGGILLAGPTDPAGAAAGIRAKEARQSKQIISVAKRYVGKVKYRSGGSSPKRGFDCSGYTKYVYKKAKIGKLPHNADAQRRMRGIHKISARKAQPGDLVFYGKPSYHVAIYAGHHKIYNASEPGTKIKKQKIHGKVTYGHLKK